MKLHNLNWRFWFFLILLAGIVLLGIKVIVMLLLNQVSYGDEEMSRVFAILLSIVLMIFLSTYLFSVLIMLKQCLVHKGRALTITSKGIENTLTFVYVFAFVIVVPIKLIPWEAVTYYDNSDGCYIRVRTKMIQAGFLAKAIVFLRGYVFCHSFTTPKVTSDEVNLYLSNLSGAGRRFSSL